MFSVYEYTDTSGLWTVLESYEDYETAVKRASALTDALDPGDRDWVLYRVEYDEVCPECGGADCWDCEQPC